MKGRQIASEVDRIGLRLQLRKRQAEAGDIILLYGDESEVLTIPILRVPERGQAPICAGQRRVQAKKVAILGSLDHMTRQLIVHTSLTSVAVTWRRISSNSINSTAPCRAGSAEFETTHVERCGCLPVAEVGHQGGQIGPRDDVEQFFLIGRQAGPHLPQFVDRERWE
jgi:hypothetical protein